MIGKELRILFMGTPDFAVESLRRLVDSGYNVVGVVTSADKPAGRGLKMQQSAVKQYATQAGLPVLQPEKLKDPEFLEQSAGLRADLGIVIAFRMLPEAVWSQPRLGTFNLHASLLPQYRGAAPINRAIMNGETVTGVTTFMLNHEIDKGAVLGSREVAISDDDSAGTLHDKLMLVGAELVVETVEKIASGSAKPIVQPASEQGLKPAPKIFREDCRIDWSADARTIYNFIRGLSPYPAAWSQLGRDDCSSCACIIDREQAVVVKIYRAIVCDNVAGTAPGTIATDGKTFLSVACGKGALRIEQLQASGKKRMETAEFLRGFHDIAEYKFA